MSSMSLWLSFTFVVIALFLSMWQKLGLEKEIAIGTVRSAVQLLAIGYVLQFVFHTDHPVYHALVLAMMIAVASWNASRRGEGLPGIWWRVAASLTVTAALTMSLLVLLRLIQPTPQYLIPISGMIIGNAMIVAGLFLSHMNREAQTARGEIEVLLCLGANKRQAIHDVLKRAVKASMIPTFDTMKTIGLVQLPGTMTGMIIAGASPLEAVRYQILIMFAFSSSAAISAVLISILAYSSWFTRESTLRP
ncbi:iron export ABC transporter permease subunit FetB [Brevibacillus ruminantium]|uniref:Iron export ABC transporter permease subunit FetB n=1 Tax=Brevibacillus ruminantium TaxID=2950604 RepID=A0ABY4WDT5_9BACL|nr:iron export ABC transporter permease subunit FetB [Brevibacillus ruminantium]USG65223.1 iron export ABC transporter permease subunit FetB [Brevibacillus ruminantium]